jgi:6-hydroxycyclohex-1-ene-1-carbonyl-CoA dehydrogenase
MTEPGQPLTLGERALDESTLSATDVVVRVSGCGICHTDIGFLYDGVRPGHALPLTLGHEIAGVVERANGPFETLVGKSVIVPAVIPCDRCELCLAGHGSICREQVFPGSDVHGGFASHTVVPGHGLCLVDTDRLEKSGLELAELSVIADAVSTAYQSIVRSGLTEGDIAVIVGAGGVGGFGAQVAAALGAEVIAIDIDPSRLEALAGHGPAKLINPKDRSPRDIRKEIAAHAEAKGLSRHRWKIFETSGSAAGQNLAFSLLTFGAYLGVVGYTLEKVSIRLANLMAFNATAEGNWGCLPKHYPAVLDLVLDGKVALRPFIEKHPMSDINNVFDKLRKHELSKRAIVIPDF